MQYNDNSLAAQQCPEDCWKGQKSLRSGKEAKARVEETGTWREWWQAAIYGLEEELEFGGPASGPADLAQRSLATAKRKPAEHPPTSQTLR